MTKKEILKELGKPKINEMMDIHHYWYIIQDSIEYTNNQEEQELFLIDELSKLKLQEIIGFENRTRSLIDDLNSREILCASIIINYFATQDSFLDFRAWIISLGKEAFHQVKENPDSLIRYVTLDHFLHEFETFLYIPSEAFERLSQQSIYDYIEREPDHINCNMKTNWLFEKPDEMASVCPELFKLFKQSNLEKREEEIEMIKAVAENFDISKLSRS